MHDNYLVVGAGITGSTIACLLSQDRDNEVTVIDRRDHIGGNCYDYHDENGITVHRYGSHIFHTSRKDVWEFLNRYTSFRPYEHKVRAVIGGKETVIPFNIDSIRQSFPSDVADRMERKMLERYGSDARIPITDLLDNEDDDIRSLAQFVYDNVFKNYTIKQWGRPLSDMDKEVATRVPVVLNNDPRYFRDEYQGIPTEGYTKMMKRMLDAPNVKVMTNTDLHDIDISRYSKVFYTGSIDELMDYSLGALPYRSERFEFETLDEQYYQSGAVINYPNDYEFTRIHEFKYYLDEKSDETVIAREYPEEFVIGSNERYYPILTRENQELYSRYLDLAKKKYPNMYFLGRLGDYRYYDMDKAVARAMDVYKEVFD